MPKSDRTAKPQPECAYESDGRDFFVTFNGVSIAKRGHPNSPQAKQWVSLEPGFAVYGGTATDDPLVIEQSSVRLQ